MSAKDTKMIPPDDSGGGEGVLGCGLEVVGVEVGGGSEVGCQVDRGGMEKVASSPDSAIDLTEDAKVEAETKAEDLVSELLDELLGEVTQMRRRRKKKRARFTDSEKWGLMKDCGLVGWKRILARNCDDGDGWGFNFVAPTGVRLTARELEKFLKKRKLTMEELSFVAKGEGIGEGSYPRKKAKLKMGYPKFKMRDLKLSKAEEIARRKLQSQTRLKEKMAEWGEFKSISEYLASLDTTSQNSSCSDLSRLASDPDPDSDCDLVEENESKLSRIICTELVAECVAMAVEGYTSSLNSSSSGPEEESPTAAKDVRILSLERSIEEVKQRLTGMMHKESQDTPQKLKLSIKDRPIEKLVITPERLKSNCAISHPNKNSPKLKIKLPRDSAESSESIKLTIKTPKAVANKAIVTKLKKKKREKSGESKDIEEMTSPGGQVERVIEKVIEKGVVLNGKLPGKKYSIFKTRNDSREQSPSLVKFTDKNARKSLNIRKSLDEPPDTPPQVGELRNHEENVASPEIPLKIVIETESSEDGDLQDEFARTVKQESPRGKMPVAQHDTVPINPNARRNIFGAHSPICHDELSPEKRVLEVNSTIRPASRARGRVISTEDAMQATNAVLDPYEMPAPETSQPSMSLMSPPPTSLTATPTPSLPLLSPQCEGRASTVTTPSLPSLSPAMPLLSRHSTPLPHSPCLPDLSPQEHRLPRRPEGILPRRSQTATPSSSLSSPTPSVETSKIPPPLPVSQRLSIDIPTDPAIQPTKLTSPLSRQEEATPESQGSSGLPVQVAKTPADTKTGRKMRDCRKFIHYEFSPPFMSSESSQSEVEVTEGEVEGVRKMTKKRGRPRKTLSMEEKPREESPTKEVAQQQQQHKKRGRKPMKSKSTDDTMLQTTATATTTTTGDSGWPQVKAKRKRGRPPKNAQDTSSMSVSQMASKLEESHVQSRSQIISQQRQSLLSRRCSEGSETKRLENEPAQLRQERSHSFDTVDGIDQLTRQLLESHPQLLLKAPPNSMAKPEKEFSKPPEAGPSTSASETLKVQSDSRIVNGAISPEESSTTTIVRKKVTVQRWSEPLMNIVDHLPKKNSPPPQSLDQEDPERPTTPPPGTCTIYQENLDLLDGMRVLTKIGPHFYPGKVTAVEGSSIFAVSVEGERGNKPHIYPAEVLLQKTLLDVKPGSRRYTPPGTRVCVLWSPKLNFLYPGTVKSFPASKQFVFVELDDGDQREIHIDNVRLLPRTYPKVLSKTKRESPLGEVEDDTMIRLPISAISPESKKRLPGKPGNLQGQHKFHEKPPPQKLSEEPGKLKADIKDATLNADLLKDGLRILNKKNGHFYPGRLNAVRPPDIYGILLDNERGFRPNIYAREELLEDAIREIKVKTADLPMGTRVCAYWSAKYHFLHPGTVIPVSSTLDKNPGKYLNVELDDGDTREVHIDQLRLLPPNYPKITYSDPLESPRKRSTSRPSTPRDGTRSDQSRPGSALSDFSDVEIRSPGQNEPATKKLGISFEASRTEVLNDLSIGSPPPPILSPKESEPRPAKKPFSKIFIPPAVSKPATTDLVGLISMGIDKLVDKKVVGNRNNFSPGFHVPPSHPSQPPPPRFGPSPPPPLTSSSSSSPSSMSPVRSEPTTNSAPPVTETGAKAKSRLSSLIQAMSGKMKKPESSQPAEAAFAPLPPPPSPLPPHIPASGPPVQVNKWMTAFNVKPPLVSPSKERTVPSHVNVSQVQARAETEEKEVKSGTEDAVKFRHKHNILLGYDFVDENDSDIMAWDMAVNRRKKTEKPKLLRESEIKEEVEDKPEMVVSSTMNLNNVASDKSIQHEVNNTMNTILTSITDEEKMRISLLSAALKKYSPIKLPGNKSPKGQDETKKKKKKSAKRLSLSSDDENSRSEKGGSRRESEESTLSDGQPTSEVPTEEKDSSNKVVLPRRHSDPDRKGEIKPQSQRNSVDNFDDLLAICEESNIGVEAPKSGDKVMVNGEKQELDASTKSPESKICKASEKSICETLIQKIGLTRNDEEPAQVSAPLKTNEELAQESVSTKSSDDLRQESELILSQVAKFRGKGSEAKKEKLEKKMQKLEEIRAEQESQMEEAPLHSGLVEEIPIGERMGKTEEPEIKLIKVDDQGEGNTIDEKKQGKIKNGFIYRDPELPEGWCIMMKRRENGKLDPFYITPCHKRLRSKQEVIKYVGEAGVKLPGKREYPMPLEEMPLRSDLSKEDFDATKNIDPAIFVLPEPRVSTEESSGDLKVTKEEVLPLLSMSIPRIEDINTKEDKDTELLEEKIKEETPEKVDESIATVETKSKGSTPVKNPLKKRILKGSKISPLKRLGINKGKNSFNLIKKKKILKNHKLKIQNEKKRRLLRNSIVAGVESREEVDEKEHIFKVPSLERFQLQKRKSAKLASPTIEDSEARGSCSKRNTENAIEKEDVFTEDNLVLNGITITKTVAVSIKRVKEPILPAQKKEAENEVEEEEEDEKGESNKENENSPEKDEEVLPKRITRNNIRSERPCPKSKATKWKSTISDIDAEEGKKVDGETKEKQQELKSLESESELPAEEEMNLEEEKPRATKRKTRSSGSDPELSEEVEEDLDGEKMAKKFKKPKLNDAKEKVEKNTETNHDKSSSAEEEEPKIEGSAKTSPRINGMIPMIEPVNEECPVNESDNAQVDSKIKVENTSDENTQEKTRRIPRTKCKLLGPRSRRKRAVETSDEEKEDQSEDHEHKVKAKEANLTVVNEIECALSPPSPKKDAPTDEEEADHQDEEDEESKEESAAPGFSPVPKSTYDFLLQRKHVRCDVKLVSLFQSELCKAVCNHCADPESFTVHTLQVDLPRQVVYMECQACGWTTVRRVTIAAVTVS